MNESEAEDDAHFTLRCEDHSLLALQLNADRRTDLALKNSDRWRTNKVGAGIAWRKEL